RLVDFGTVAEAVLADQRQVAVSALNNFGEVFGGRTSNEGVGLVDRARVVAAALDRGGDHAAVAERVGAGGRLIDPADVEVADLIDRSAPRLTRLHDHRKVVVADLVDANQGR